MEKYYDTVDKTARKAKVENFIGKLKEKVNKNGAVAFFSTLFKSFFIFATVKGKCEL